MVFKESVLFNLALYIKEKMLQSLLSFEWRLITVLEYVRNHPEFEYYFIFT